jgi:hypothetical protein
MLVKIVSFLVCLLISVSCSSISDDGAEVTVPFSQVGEALIKEALDTPEISSQLTSSSHAILSSIASKNEFAMPFYGFAVQKYDFDYFGFEPENPQSWNAFVNCSFRDFSRQEADQAQAIINKIVLPSHPFLSQVQFKLHTTDFLGHFIPDIDVFLDKVAKDIFAQQFSQILALEDQSEAQILLKALLHKTKNSSFPDPAFKYHHAFLANVPFDYFKRTYSVHSEYHNNINSFISQLASSLYYEIAEDSKQLADKMLSRLLPSIYSKINRTSYVNTIRMYQKSLLQPIDKSYLWDPQEFQVDLLEAIQALRIVENYILPPYLKMIEFLSGDSHLAHLFRHYIAQNYFKPSYISPQHQPLFWRSLIYSSFTEFSTIFPHRSHQILRQLQLLTSIDEVEHIFVYGILDKQFSCENHFLLVSGWGHTFIVKLLFERRTSPYCTRIFVDYIGYALLHASKMGPLSLVKILLESHFDIPADAAGEALANAALDGNTSVVELLLQHRTDISDNHIGMALNNAAHNGHTFTVEFLLQCQTDIPVAYVGLALECASMRGNTLIVKLLLQSRSDISANYVDSSLEYASKKGSTLIVELLRQHQLNMNR